MENCARTESNNQDLISHKQPQGGDRSDLSKIHNPAKQTAHQHTGAHNNSELTVLKTTRDKLARLKAEGLMGYLEEADQIASDANQRAAAAESERDSAIRWAKAAENERNQAVRRATAAESERDFANQRSVIAESDCDHAIERAAKAEFERDQAVRKAAAAETERDFANQRSFIAESECDHAIERAIKAESERNQAVRRASTAESERELANQRVAETNQRFTTARVLWPTTWSTHNKGPNVQLRNGGLEVVLDCSYCPGYELCRDTKFMILQLLHIGDDP